VQQTLDEFRRRVQSVPRRHRHIEEEAVTVRLNPYISFQGQAREAMDFYKSVFGGQLDVSTYGESGMADDPSQGDMVMHAMLDTGDGLVLMGSDNPPGMPYEAGQRITISLSGDDDATLRRYWDGLTGNGGTVTMPLERAPWGDSFGMCSDRFGVNWLVNITGVPAAAQ
jgi:PhnB protein